MSRSGSIVVIIVLVVGATAPDFALGQCDGTWTLQTPAMSPTSRLLPGMVYDSDRHVMVLFGGDDGNPQADTWEYDGTNWTQRFPATSPSPRSAAQMAYDSVRHKTVLFGGFDDQLLNDETWEWDGTNWSRPTFPTNPPRRVLGGMTFDSARGVTVLYGGLFAEGELSMPGDVKILGDTWVYNGTEWKEVFLPASPPPFAGPSLTFDSNRNVAVLFGGTALTTPADELWEWDGSHWAQRIPGTPVTPPARYVHGAAFDSAHGVTVVFGGLDVSNATLNDTWEWNGTVWVERMPAGPPSARDEVGMDYDSARDVIVMFGGGTDETWERETSGLRITDQPDDVGVAAGASASFIVAVADAVGTATFAWRKDGTPLSDGGSISGSSTATLTINPTTVSDAGSYDVVVSDTCRSLTSQAAKLDPCVGSGSNDCNGNGVLDACEIAADPSLDADNNGTLDSCETADDGNPQAPCGACGAGMATMTPFMLLAFAIRRRHRLN